MIYRLIYTSRAAIGIKAQELVPSRSAYKNYDITGWTLQCDDRILQVLEGPRDHVDRVFAKIEKDGRHTSVCVLAQGAFPTKEFSGSDMSYKKVVCEDEQVEFDRLVDSLTEVLEKAA